MIIFSSGSLLLLPVHDSIVRVGNWQILLFSCAGNTSCLCVLLFRNEIRTRINGGEGALSICRMYMWWVFVPATFAILLWPRLDLCFYYFA